MHEIAVLGLHHDHVWSNLEELLATGKGKLVVAADPDPELRARYRERFPGDVVETYDEALDNYRFDAAYLFASNRASEIVSVAALRRGIHCLVEKPMAATLSGAEAMARAAEASGARLMVNWPFAWWTQLRHGIVMAQSGELGRLWQVRYRAAHQGPVELGCSPQFCEWLYDLELNGAGALMDYCCYGAVLADLLLGQPERVQGTALRTGLKPDLALEDNAVLVLSYPGALALSEASWTQIGHLTAYGTAIYGSEGTLLIEPGPGGRILHATREEPEGRVLEVPPQPAQLANASAHFLALLEDPSLETLPLCSARHGLGAQRILDAGMRAAGIDGPRYS